jgi:hypothetical protein
LTGAAVALVAAVCVAIGRGAPVLGHGADPWALASGASVAAVVVLQLLFTYAPFMHSLFNTRPLGVGTLFAIGAAGVAVLLILEVEKALLRRFYPGKL